jgi:phosphopantothenoylcysteine synthetase/decarboxylase
VTAESNPSRVLYMVACAAPPTLRLTTGVQVAKSKGWNVRIVLTRSARSWVSVPELVRSSGYPVRIEHKLPGEPDIFPLPDAVLVAPATFNTLNKWATGISDNLALSLINESIGKDLPIAAVPFLNEAQSRHPAFKKSLDRLRENGVRILYGEHVVSPTKPDSGISMAESFPWSEALDELRKPCKSSSI